MRLTLVNKVFGTEGEASLKSVDLSDDNVVLNKKKQIINPTEANRHIDNNIASVNKIELTPRSNNLNRNLISDNNLA